MSLTVVEFSLEDHYTVHTIDNINKMFEMLELITPELILLDLFMPDMTCRDVMQRLKENAVHANIPVIIMSGSNSPETIAECIEMGAIHFIPKPVLEPDDFLKEIKRWLQ